MCWRKSSVDQSRVADPTIVNGWGNSSASASWATAGMSRRLVRSPEAPKRSMRSIIECHPFLAASWRSPELAVEVVGGADKCQVGEGLREVAELFAGRPDLFGVEPDVVRVAEHLLEGQPRLVEPSGAGERLHPPEGAHREGRLPAGEPIGRRVDVVAVDEAVGDQLGGDGVEGRDPARVGGHDE